MAVSFLEFLGGEQQTYSISLLRLAEDFTWMRRVDALFGRFHDHAAVIDDERKHIKFLADFTQVRFYTSVLAYMRGQRGEAFGITRNACESAINAYLLHRGLLSRAGFEQGGRSIHQVYRSARNASDRMYCPELVHLFDIRDKLTKWGGHSEFSSFVFRIKDMEDEARVLFSFFDVSELDAEFRFYFHAVLGAYLDALEVFCCIDADAGEGWAIELGNAVIVLKQEQEFFVRGKGWLDSSSST